MIYAMDGGLWLHRHVWFGRPMAHLVSVDRELLLRYGESVGLPAEKLQYKPLRDPRSGVSHAIGLLVVTLSGNQICAITRFDTSVLPRFGLPRTLPD